MDYRALSEQSGGILPIELQRDGDDDELILGLRSPESEWTKFQHAVNLDFTAVRCLVEFSGRLFSDPRARPAPKAAVTMAAVAV